MTAVEFTSLLNNSSFSEFPQKELENALEAYPYCQPLRFLLLKKYYKSQHPQKEDQLQLAATYATDRSYLFHLLSEVNVSNTHTEINEEEEVAGDVPESSLMTEDAVTGSVEHPDHPVVLTEIEEGAISDQPIDLTIVPDSEPLEEAIGESPHLLGSFEIALEEEQAEAVDLPLLEIAALDIDLDSISEGLKETGTNSPIPLEDEGSFDFSELLSSQEEAIPDVVEKPKKAKPEKKKKKRKRKKNRPTPEIIADQEQQEPQEQTETPLSFIDWLTSLSETPLETRKKGKGKKAKSIKVKAGKPKNPGKPKKKKRKIGKKAADLAQISVIDHDDNVSETLAKLLTLQGNKEKALQMYQRLILKFPEKSTYFAVQIENIKSQL